MNRLIFGLLSLLCLCRCAAAGPLPSSGLVFWIDASDLNGDGLDNNPADGAAVGVQNVSPWISKVGSASGEERTVGADRFPHYIASSSINGAPAVRFQKSSPTLNSDALKFYGYKIDPLKPYTAFIVEERATVFDGAYYSTGVAIGFKDGDALRTPTNSQTQLRIFPGNGNVGPTTAAQFPTRPGAAGSFTDIGSALASPTAGVFQTNILNYWTDAIGDVGPQASGDVGDAAGNAELWVNGILKYISNTTRRYSNANHDLVVGMMDNPITGLDSYNGDIAEMIFYDRALSAAELSQVGYYLEQKYTLDTAYVPEPVSRNLAVLAGILVIAGYGRKTTAVLGSR